MLIDLVQLRTFVGVAEEQHLTRAAERLHISQSAASAHVRAIEDNLGTQLFVRANRSLKLTHSGELLLDRARNLLNEASIFTSFARELQGKLEGNLVVGSSSDPSSRVAEIIARLHDTHPLISIDLRARPSAAARQDLKTGELDVGVLLGPLVEQNLTHYELARIGFRVAGPVDWKERIEAAGWEELADMPWITPLDSCGAYSALLAQLFESRGLTPHSIVRFDNATTLASAMLRARIGLMLMREARALQGERDGCLALSPIARTELPLFAAHLTSRRNDPLIDAFVKSTRKVWTSMRAVGGTPAEQPRACPPGQTAYRLAGE